MIEFFIAMIGGAIVGLITTNQIIGLVIGAAIGFVAYLPIPISKRIERNTRELPPETKRELEKFNNGN